MNNPKDVFFPSAVGILRIRRLVKWLKALLSFICWKEGMGRLSSTMSMCPYCHQSVHRNSTSKIINIKCEKVSKLHQPNWNAVIQTLNHLFLYESSIIQWLMSELAKDSQLIFTYCLSTQIWLAKSLRIQNMTRLQT